MNRLVPLSLAFAIAAMGAAAAETDPEVTLAELEARPTKASSDPSYWPAALAQTKDAFRLIESTKLTTADEFFRVSKFVTASDNHFRASRVRYELLLAAAVLGHTEAEKEIAVAWDELLAAIGRPLRTDFKGLAQKHPDFYQVEAAPDCVQALLRDPEKARAAAKSAALNTEMKAIVEADQADRRSDWGKLNADERRAIHDRDIARNLRAREIILTGDLRTAADFANASLVMQHSPRFAGYQIAHELAVCSMLLGDRGRGRWLIAATYDRMLGSVGHDQRFGTQYSGYGAGGASTLDHVDTAGICDAQRKALGCPTLEEVKNRNVGAAQPKESSKLVAEFSGPNRSVRDPKFGLTTTYPEGWKIREVLRWGDQQNTIFFDIDAAPEPSPNLYYRVYQKPRPRTPEEMVAFVREEAKKKEASRRENIADYTNRADSFKTFSLGGNAAFSWSADFTGPSGDKWVEYFVRIQTENADASFFLQSPASQIDALRPAVDRLMAELKMPMPQN